MVVAHIRANGLRPKGAREREEEVEDLDSSQRVRDHLVAYHLAPTINDFISDVGNAATTNLSKH